MYCLLSGGTFFFSEKFLFTIWEPNASTPVLAETIVCIMSSIIEQFYYHKQCNRNSRMTERQRITPRHDGFS